MKSLQDYPIGFSYKAQDGQYYYTPNSPQFPYGKSKTWVGNYHRGDDYFTPEGVPVLICGVSIGLTGSTGVVSGPHCHVQAWTGSPTNDTNPLPYTFRGGRVVTADNNVNQQWGKHVTIEVKGVYVTYAHLSRIDVVEGQIIKEEEMIENTEGHYVFANLLHERLRGTRSLSKEDFQGWVGQSWLKYVQALAYDKESEIGYEALKVGKVALEDKWHEQITDRDKWLSDLNSELKNVDKSADEKLKAIQSIVNK